jgi:hypothetical protein
LQAEKELLKKRLAECLPGSSSFGKASTKK